MSLSRLNYALWYAEQKTPTPEDRRADRPTEPKMMSGFWRILAARTKPDPPVSIWTDTGQDATIFQIGRLIFNTVEHPDKWQDFVSSSWLHCVAVTQEQYDLAQATGKWSDDKPPFGNFTDEEKLDIIPDTPALAGGNMGEDQFHAQVVSKIEAELAKVPALQWPFETLDEANKAASIVETLRALGKQGEAKRKSEKQPFLDQAAAVDAKWIKVREASEAVQRLVSAIDTFQRAEKARLQREADQREAAERERLAEEARKQAEQAGQPVDEAEVAAMVEERLADAPMVPVEAPRVGTAHGRAISKPKTKTATIIDMRALAEHFIHAGDEDFAAYMGKRADAAARAKITLPGTKIDD